MLTKLYAEGESIVLIVLEHREGRPGHVWPGEEGSLVSERTLQRCAKVAITTAPLPQKGQGWQGSLVGSDLAVSDVLVQICHRLEKVPILPHIPACLSMGSIVYCWSRTTQTGE